MKINLLGHVGDASKVKFCLECKLPINIGGKLIPCNHLFCRSCAQGSLLFSVCSVFASFLAVFFLNLFSNLLFSLILRCNTEITGLDTLKEEEFCENSEKEALESRNRHSFLTNDSIPSHLLVKGNESESKKSKERRSIKKEEPNKRRIVSKGREEEIVLHLPTSKRKTKILSRLFSNYKNKVPTNSSQFLIHISPQNK